jgi:hypothetical protein
MKTKPYFVFKRGDKIVGEMHITNLLNETMQ